MRYYSEGHRGKDINGIGGGVRNNAVIIIIIIIIIIIVVVIILILILFLSAGETTVSMQDGQGNISWRVVWGLKIYIISHSCSRYSYRFY